MAVAILINYLDKICFIIWKLLFVFLLIIKLFLGLLYSGFLKFGDLLIKPQSRQNYFFKILKFFYIPFAFIFYNIIKLIWKYIELLDKSKKGQRYFCLGLLFLFFSLAIYLYATRNTGIASFYAGKFIGRKTANGEIYTGKELTAAHKTLPFNTRVRVINLKNNKSVVVRINDRGPFVFGRIIDLSPAAAKKLDMLKDGIVKVKLEIIEKK